METTVKLYSLEYKSIKTYLVASLFILGNIFFPQLCHLVNLGPVLLPIYFFTLIGAYKYGWKVGLLTAILSPLINSLLFGMPAPAALPAILSKSIILAITAGVAAQHFKRISILLLFGVVVFSQIAGTLAEWAIDNSFYKAIQDFRIGIYGMLLQILGGFLLIKYVIKR